MVRFPGCSLVSTGFSMGSMTFGYDRSSFFNCIEKKEKSKIHWRISSMELLRCRNKRPTKGLVRFVKTMNFSPNVMSPTSNCNSTVEKSAFYCPLATINWNSGGGPSFIIVCGASNWILRRSASGMALDKPTVFMSQWILNSPKSIGYLWASGYLTPRNPLEI